MSVNYDNYLANHRENVRKAAEWIRYNLPYALSDYESYNDICWRHDESKDSIEEYYAYDEYFYGRRTKAVEEEFNQAWLHHIHHSPHHWQHWILINDEADAGIVALRMPYRYVIEMICDWWSFSWTKNSLYEIFNWYDAHKSTMKLHDDTREVVEKILSDIRVKLDEQSAGDEM